MAVADELLVACTVEDALLVDELPEDEHVAAAELLVVCIVVDEPLVDEPLVDAGW